MGSVFLVCSLALDGELCNYFAGLIPMANVTPPYKLADIVGKGQRNAEKTNRAVSLRMTGCLRTYLRCNFSRGLEFAE